MSEEAKSASENEKTVIVYSTPLCAPCEALKSYLREHGVAFTATDLMMDEAAADKMAALNIRSSPVLEVDGEILAGPTLTQEKVNSLLGIG
ncbi:MAG TPA: glutaredoxin family protein [Hyphomicrobiales bacterium]|nr:glutaredoxin family protein [Hyphomicrobiales bacterium]